MRSGDPVGISDPDGWAGSALYFAASRAAPADLDLVGADHDTLQAWADHYIEERDWTQSGCVLAGEEHPHVAGYLTAMRRWDRCEGLPDASLWELAGASDDGRVLLILQLLPGTVPEDTATAMVSSFAVAPERLPAKTNPSKSPIAP